MMTGSLKKKDLKKKKKNVKDFFFFNLKKRGGGSLIRACSLIRSNTVYTIIAQRSENMQRQKKETYVRTKTTSSKTNAFVLCY